MYATKWMSMHMFSAITWVGLALPIQGQECSLLGCDDLKWSSEWQRVPTAAISACFWNVICGCVVCCPSCLLPRLYWTYVYACMRVPSGKRMSDPSCVKPPKDLRSGSHVWLFKPNRCWDCLPLTLTKQPQQETLVHSHASQINNFMTDSGPQHTCSLSLFPNCCWESEPSAMAGPGMLQLYLTPLLSVIILT